MSGALCTYPRKFLSSIGLCSTGASRGEELWKFHSRITGLDFDSCPVRRLGCRQSPKDDGEKDLTCGMERALTPLY